MQKKKITTWRVHPTHGAVVHELETRSEVREYDVSGAIQQDVVGFDVAVHVRHSVQRVDRENHLGDVELSHLLRQTVLELGEQREQVAAAVVVHHEVLQQ